MGKGTDKLYITHSEWSSADAFSASKGSNASGSNVPGANFRRLPFNFCAVSLQPFRDPVCTSTGTIFDHTEILSWLTKHPNTNPVDGSILSRADLTRLHFMKNDDGEYVDPVTYRVLTDNSHIVALKNTGNVFTWDTVDRLNIKAKNWKDLVSEEDFTRKDIITLQDPQNLAARDLSSFKYMQDGISTVSEAQEEERSSTVNASALGSSAKMIKAKETVARARAARDLQAKQQKTASNASRALRKTSHSSTPSTTARKPPAYNAALHTTGKAAASFTSTGLTPETSGTLATLTDEEYLLRPKRVRTPGYARLVTNHGTLNLELLPEHAPRAVWNFITHSKAGYYAGTVFHRNIKNFMIQGGDPTGTGRGGKSIWGPPFKDEFEGPMKHDARGIMSMANKGKNTNQSQFFITYRATPHLDRKHTIFARVVGGMDTLARLEKVECDEKDKPKEDIVLEDIVVYVDPFEEFLKTRAEKEQKEAEDEEIKRQGGTEDDKTTWTGKRIRGDGTVDAGGGTAGVGKYLKAALANSAPTENEDDIVGDWDEPEEPVKKKIKSGGFGNFDSW